MRRQRPGEFADISLAIVKLMGRGEYVVETPGEPPIGHFGLAVRDYAHSTAPNRRFPDLVTQRVLKAALDGRPPAYSREELEGLARRCTAQEDAADKVERQLRKSAAALMLESHVGERFELPRCRRAPVRPSPGPALSEAVDRVGKAGDCLA